MRHKLGRLYILVAAVTMLSGVMSPVVLAFSAYGSGTSGNPYRIATCAQLEEINNNLSAYYILISNINCTGVSFTHLADSTPFSGTLDGQDHTISNLSIDADGLFNETDGATIENLTISSGSVSGTTAGSFVADAIDTTLTNLHSSMTVSSSDDSGGVAGALHGTSSIADSSFSGILTGGTAYSGGLVSTMWDSTCSITDSFVSGALSSEGSYFGSIVGGYFNGSINRVYSSATLSINGHPYNGGLVGDSQGSLNDSFSATTLQNRGSNDGAIFGLNVSGTLSNDYFDQYLSGTSTVCGSGASCSAIAENAGNATPNYFQDNSTNGPFSTWDFSQVWETTATYPTLRDIALFTAPSGIPNNGDANGDGIPDSYQATVASIEAPNGVWSTVMVPSSSNCTLGNVASVGTMTIPADTGYSPLVNYDSFTVYCPTSGDTVPVTIIYDKQYNTSSSVLRYYNAQTHTYATVAGATFGTATIGGVIKTTVTYNITDGGPFDADGAANGVIVDPVAFANPAPTTLTDTGINLDVTSAVAITLTALAGTIRFVPRRVQAHTLTSRVRMIFGRYPG